MNRSLSAPSVLFIGGRRMVDGDNFPKTGKGWWEKYQGCVMWTGFILFCIVFWVAVGYGIMRLIGGAR